MKLPLLGAVLVFLGTWQAYGQGGAARPAAVVREVEGKVEMQLGGSPLWNAAAAGSKLAVRDRLRTLERSRAVVQLEDFSMLRVGERSLLEILPPRETTAKSRLNLLRGALYFLHRNEKRELEVDTPAANAVIEGTEFQLSVGEDGATTLTLFDGRVELRNEQGRVTLAPGEQGIAEPGKAPRKTAAVEAANIVQWTLYYPAVLDLAELELTNPALVESVTRYRKGDLLGALEAIPARFEGGTDDERIFLAGLRLFAGRSLETTAGLIPAEETHRAAGALRLLRLAVEGRQSVPTKSMFENSGERRVGARGLQDWTEKPGVGRPGALTGASFQTRSNSVEGSSQQLALSYLLQSCSNLTVALHAAETATRLSPSFGFAWTRVAELQFSRGRNADAEIALRRALELSPENAQARALHGFLLLAREQVDGARAAFDAAIQADGALGNAWLGRGLVQIRTGNAEGGRADLQTAVAVEPNRWLFRNYLAKAYLHTAQRTSDGRLRADLLRKAAEELALAGSRDPADPTPWLYSALLNHQRDHIADAIRDLEKSVALNDNRAVYRSRFLLDQDQAVRSANLANIYESAGMREVSLRESARAVMFDYANYSAHLNLASSYNVLRDPTRFNLRNETEWSSESLIASLLAPPGAGSLSQNYSQNEYSRAFVGPRLGLNSTTEYFSDAREIRQTTAQFGYSGNTAYAFDLDYDTKRGNRVNNDLSRVEWYTTVKQQLTPADSVLVRVKYQNYESGDNFQYLNPANASPNLRFTETQEPILLAGYHHEWSPGSHTLLLGGRLVNEQHLTDSAARHLVAITPLAQPSDPALIPYNEDYRSSFETWSAELQQIFQRERHTDILGARYQRGEFTASSQLDNVSGSRRFGGSIPTVGDGDLERMTLYAYHNWELTDGLLLTGGVAYDQLTSPLNFRRPPLAAGELETHRWLPKAALIYHPVTNFVARAIYARTLGGVSYDESIRLEPTQLAGFSQSFRTLISESLVGSVEAPTYDILGGGLDFKLPTATYVTIEALERRQRVDRQIGVLYRDPRNVTIMPGTTAESLGFRERSAVLTVNQALAPNVFLELQYRVTDSRLQRDLPTIPASPTYARSTTSSAALQQWRGAVLFTLPESFFARAEATWWEQKGGDALAGVSDAFPQINLLTGWHFRNRRGELAVGLLNVTGRDYRLSPINYYNELPRERALYTRLRFNF